MRYVKCKQLVADRSLYSPNAMFVVEDRLLFSFPSFMSSRHYRRLKLRCITPIRTCGVPVIRLVRMYRSWRLKEASSGRREEAARPSPLAPSTTQSILTCLPRNLPCPHAPPDICPSLYQLKESNKSLLKASIGTYRWGVSAYSSP